MVNTIIYSIIIIIAISCGSQNIPEAKINTDELNISTDRLKGFQI